MGENDSQSGEVDRADLVEELREDVTRGVDVLTESYVLLVVLGVLIGLQIAPAVLAAAPTTGAQPQVAVIRLGGGIDGSTANEVAAQIERARADPQIKAIVLRVNSPGGGAAASEQLYLTLARAAKEMPVIVSVNAIAASGAYYAAVAGDYIYVKPSSLIGSVGVILVAPQEIPPTDRIIDTGPAKLSGGDRRSWYYKIDAAKQAFLGAVMTQRGDALTIPRTEVATAKLFSAPRAVQTGIADEIGGLQTAIQHAAEAANLRDYGVTVLSGEDTATFVSRAAYVASPMDDKRLVGPQYFVGNGTGATGPHILMLAKSVAYQAFGDDVVSATANDNESASANETAALLNPGEVM